MPTARTRKPRSTRTRADVTASFEELETAHESRETMDSNAAGLATEHAERTRAAVKGISVDKIVQSGATLGLEITRTLTGLTEQCVAKATELKTLEDAIKIEGEELERLYGLDIASASIAGLIEDHKTKKEELEKEQDTLRATWIEEQTAHNKEAALKADELRAARRREEEQYAYNKMQERNRADDDFARKMALQDREQADKNAAFDKKLAEHNAKLAAEDQEIVALRARVAGIDVEIKREVDKAEKILTNVLTKDHRHETELLKRDYDAKLSLEANKNANYEKNNSVLAARILELEAEVKSAHAKIAETAKAALESASGQATVTALKEFQANTNGSINKRQA